MLQTFKQHWPEYVIEACLLGIFMISAAVFTILFEYPGLPTSEYIQDPTLRRIIIGLAMGGTCVALIYSPIGKRSGAHMNPAVTLAFYSLGKVSRADTAWYILFQFIGGFGGIALVGLVVWPYLSAPSVEFIATVPGPTGPWVACIAEFGIAYLMMSAVLFSSNRPSLSAWTGWISGMLVTSFVIFESPLSGFGMNPARTFGSALLGWIWTALWLYFIAPLAGMLLAAQVYRALGRPVKCAKLHHPGHKHCIFHCEYLQKLDHELHDRFKIP